MTEQDTRRSGIRQYWDASPFLGRARRIGPLGGAVQKAAAGILHRLRLAPGGVVAVLRDVTHRVGHVVDSSGAVVGGQRDQQRAAGSRRRAGPGEAGDGAIVDYTHRLLRFRPAIFALSP